MNILKLVSLTTLAMIISLNLSLPTKAFPDDDKKKEELRRKIEALKKKKSKIKTKTEEKLLKVSDPGKTNLDEIIAKYERLNKNCEGKKSERCADIMYTLSKLYYDKARDDYIKARNNYEKAMDQWEKNPEGPEPLNPIPNYSRSLDSYQKSVSVYPKFIKADEGYFQIGNILRLNGDLDGAKDSFKKLVSLFPKSIRASPAHFRLSEFCFMDRDFTCALKHIQKIREGEINPEVQEMAHYRKAEIFYNRAEFDKAVELFYTYVEKCDNNEYPKKDLRSEALEYLSISFSDMPNGAKEAIDFFKKHGNKPYENYVIYTVGMKNFDHGQYDQAILALRTAIENFPYYELAPEAQQRIVACYIIRKKYRESNKEREKLVDRYITGGEWTSRNSNNAVALEKAGNEVRLALSAIPIFYHAEAQKTKNKKLFEKATKRYQQYIDLFPNEKWKVYEFKYNMAEIHNSLRQYEQAADYYDFVATQDLSTYPEFKMELDTLGRETEEIERMKREKRKKSPVSISQEDAGYNAIVALDNLRKQKMQQSSLNDKQAYALPETKKFIEYIHSFQGKFPKSSNSPEVLYLAGNVHYSAEAYDAAIVEFKKIVVNYPKTKYGKKALRMLANTYSGAGEFAKAIDEYKNLLRREKPKTKGHKEVLDLAAGAMFKKANALRKEGNLVGAAEGFKSISIEFPSSTVADRGWFEAATSLESAENYELAAITFKELGTKFPKSPLREKAYVRSAENYKKVEKWDEAAKVFQFGATKVNKADYAIPSLSAAAENFKKAKQYNNAGQMYEMILNRFPTDKRTPKAIYNGGLTYEKGELYDNAIKLYTTLGNKYPESEYAADGFYAIGFCYEKQKKPLEMAKSFTAYAEKFPGNRSKQVIALSKASEAYMKLKKTADAEKCAITAIKVYEKFKKDTKIDPVAVAKSYFTMGKIKHQKFNAIQLKGTNAKQVKNRLKQKTSALEPVLKAYASAIELGLDKWTMHATYMIGESFLDFADAFRNQTLFGSKSQKTASRISIISGLEKYYLKAQEKFYWNIETGYEQNISNEWVGKSKTAFMKTAFDIGRLYEEIGEIFKNAPIPKGLAKDDRVVYKDVLEEKYLEALDRALPKYERGVEAASKVGITESEWLAKIKGRIEFINPSSKALDIQIEEREKKPATEENVKVDDINKKPEEKSDL